MKILFASDSFKGSLTSQRTSELLTIATKKVFPKAETISMNVADGGEGTMSAVVETLHGTWKTINVLNPIGKTITAKYGILPDNKAIIEMAEASGLALISKNEQNAAKTTSIGTGMLIKDALDAGIRDITIAIGGSATNDGGMGMLEALGVRFFDDKRNLLHGFGENLLKIADINLENLHPAINETKFTVMCDVVNPLLGEQGATFTFGKQKGANKDTLNYLEQGMTHYAKLVNNILYADFTNVAGSGAAGGLGFALMSFVNAKTQSGIDAVLDLLNFDEKLTDVDLVITGEGRMDWQSVYGKVPSGIGKRCMQAQVPAVAIVGGLLSNYEKIYDCGIESVVTTINNAMTVEEAISNSESLYLDAAIRLLRMIKCGISMAK